MELEHDKHPDWPLAKLIASAKSEFERSARLLMEGTLELGQRLRPKGLWGFYGFPDCFASNVTHYQCSEKVTATGITEGEKGWAEGGGGDGHPYLPRPHPCPVPHSHELERKANFTSSTKPT